MDAYRIGVSLVLSNGVSPALALIGQDLLRLKTSIKDIEGNFGGWAKAIGGFGAILAGATVLGAMTKLAEKAAEFQDAMIKISQIGPGMANLVESGALKANSFAIAQQLGMNVADVAKVTGGLQGVLQNPEEAMELTGIASRYARLQQMRKPGSHPEDDIQTIMRAGELSGRLTDDRGQIDTKKVEEWFDLVARLQAATHGQVNPQALLQLGQQGGGVSLRGLSNEGYEHMALVAQMMGGARAGTALLSLRQQLGGGVMMKRSAEAMQQYGLLQDGEWTTEGGHVSLTPGASKRLSSLVSEDPMKFVDEIVTRLEAKGITSKDDQMVALQRILGRQTTQRMVSDMLLARQQMARETQGLEGGAHISDAIKGYNEKSVRANLQAMHAAWNNLLTAIGSEQGGMFVKALQGITSALNVTTQLTNEHPKIVEAMGAALVGVAVGLVAVGAGVLISIAGTGVAVGAAIAAVVASVGALIALNWQSIKDMFEGIKTALTSFFDYLAGLAGRIRSTINGLFDFKGGKPTPNVDDFGRIIPNSFHPGTSQPKAQPINFSLNIDGQPLAQAVIDRMEQMTTYPTGAPSPDGVGRHFAGDHNYADI